MLTLTMEHLLNGVADDATSTSSSETSLKTEPGTTSPSSESTSSSQPLPKLPPISSLTHALGVPPSMQLPLQANANAPPMPMLPLGLPLPPSSMPMVHDERLCRYRNKLCLNPRAVKRNGELHNLCEKHRAKANQNQRKLESKRRLQKKQSRELETSTTGNRMDVDAEGTNSTFPPPLPSLSAQLQQVPSNAAFPWDRTT